MNTKYLLMLLLLGKPNIHEQGQGIIRKITPPKSVSTFMQEQSKTAEGVYRFLLNLFHNNINMIFTHFLEIFLKVFKTQEIVKLASEDQCDGTLCPGRNINKDI